MIFKETPGHWKSDLIIGKDHKSVNGTIVERSTRTVILVSLKNKETETVRKAFEREFKRLPKKMKESLIYDNGTEIVQHKLFTKKHQSTGLFHSTLFSLGTYYK